MERTGKWTRSPLPPALMIWPPRTPWDHTDPLYEFQAALATVSRKGNNVGPLPDR